MGQSFEIYNIITSPNLQINSLFTPHYRHAKQVIPTGEIALIVELIKSGTMMGEIGVKWSANRLYLQANSSYAELNNGILDLRSNWVLEMGSIVLSNVVKNNGHEIVVESEDISIAFSNKAYLVQGLEPQWHYDYRAKLHKNQIDMHG